MEIPVIPWRLFFDTLRKQHGSAIERWLWLWLFTDECAILTDQRLSPAISWPTANRPKPVLHVSAGSFIACAV